VTNDDTWVVERLKLTSSKPLRDHFDESAGPNQPSGEEQRTEGAMKTSQFLIIMAVIMLIGIGIAIII
jgi:hypothetical protein